MSPKMLAWIVCCLFILQGSLFVDAGCDTENKEENKDKVNCYDCGLTNLTTKAQEPSVDGHTISPGDVPWYATVFSKSNGQWIILCGGTLITSNAVITAAHCVTASDSKSLLGQIAPENLRVVLGNTKSTWNDTDSSAIKRKVTSVRVHPDFKGMSTNYIHDIALLLLDSEVTFSSTVMPACLDYNGNKLPTNHEDDIGYMASFGYPKKCRGSCSSKNASLNYISANITSFDECSNNTQAQYANLITLTPDKFCFGNGTQQTGHGGDGITVVHQGLHFLKGLVSVKLVKANSMAFAFSFGSVANVITNVTDHMDYIKTNLHE